ncbi:competence protein J (ComJ) [Rhodobacter viridis]|uniref:Competence protein J (ComJ) n=1 Tax=Rhodobacter viridis TaxID=1054202 RepID=A0A318TUD0_9RHOB|nr:competence protein ComJ [Rhodobacter viridis]PYF07470.1 competence protein J (ComJ) [Rhodobacter viridis]
MILDDVPMTVDYTQILVYGISHPSPSLLWTDEHVAQGFAWSEGLVSFGVPDHDGQCRLQVVEEDSPGPDPAALWAVQVPFAVNEPLAIGSVFETREVQVPLGPHALVFEGMAGTEDDAYFLRLRFVPMQRPGFAVLKTGPGVTSPVVLRDDAEIAQ